MENFKCFATAILTLLAAQSFANSNYNINPTLSFTENKGQVIDDDDNLRPDILYTLNTGNGVKAYLSKKGVSYAWIQIEKNVDGDRAENLENNIKKEKFKELENTIVNTYHMDMELIGSNENTEVVAEEMNENYFNYYLSHCPNGITHVRNYNKVTYKNIYNNIDLVFYPNRENKLEYDFVARPGANIADIKFQYKGNLTIKITENGNLEITNPLGSITEKTPFTYLQNGKRKIASQFQLNNGVVSFKVENNNINETTVIDPSLEWGTYFGGNSTDYLFDVKTDKEAVNQALRLVADEEEIIRIHEALAGSVKIKNPF